MHCLMRYDAFPPNGTPFSAGAILPADSPEVPLLTGPEALPEPWSWLVPLLERLGYPVLDRRFAGCADVTVPEAAAAADAEEEVVLHKLRLCADAGIRQLQVKRPSPPLIPRGIFTVKSQYDV